VRPRSAFPFPCCLLRFHLLPSLLFVCERWPWRKPRPAQFVSVCVCVCVCTCARVRQAHACGLYSHPHTHRPRPSPRPRPRPRARARARARARPYPKINHRQLSCTPLSVLSLSTPPPPLHNTWVRQSSNANSSARLPQKVPSGGTNNVASHTQPQNSRISGTLVCCARGREGGGKGVREGVRERRVGGQGERGATKGEGQECQAPCQIAKSLGVLNPKP